MLMGIYQVTTKMPTHSLETGWRDWVDLAWTKENLEKKNELPLKKRKDFCSLDYSAFPKAGTQQEQIPGERLTPVLAIKQLHLSCTQAVLCGAGKLLHYQPLPTGGTGVKLKERNFPPVPEFCSWQPHKPSVSEFLPALVLTVPEPASWAESPPQGWIRTSSTLSTELPSLNSNFFPLFLF